MKTEHVQYIHRTTQCYISLIPRLSPHHRGKGSETNNTARLSSSLIPSGNLANGLCVYVQDGVERAQNSESPMNNISKRSHMQLLYNFSHLLATSPTPHTQSIKHTLELNSLPLYLTNSEQKQFQLSCRQEQKDTIVILCHHAMILYAHIT